MKWWQLGVLAGVVLVYSCALAWKDVRLGDAEAERDRLARDLSESRTGYARLHGEMAAMRARADDGIRDPGRHAGRVGRTGVSLAAGTTDREVKDVFVFTPPPLPGNETVAVGPLVPADDLPPAAPKTRTYTGVLLERKDDGGDPAFVLVTRDADYWLGQDPSRTPLADLRALVGRDVRVKSAGQVTLGTRRFLMAAKVTPAGRRNDRGD